MHLPFQSYQQDCLSRLKELQIYPYTLKFGYTVQKLHDFERSQFSNFRAFFVLPPLVQKNPLPFCTSHRTKNVNILKSRIFASIQLTTCGTRECGFSSSFLAYLKLIWMDLLIWPAIAWLAAAHWHPVGQPPIAASNGHLHSLALLPQLDAKLVASFLP